MKSLASISVLLGLATNLHGAVSAVVPIGDSLDPTTNKSETSFATAMINTTTLDGWPPFYSTADPQDLCGDTIGHTKSSDDVPNSKDCATLRDSLDAKPGLWNITANSGLPNVYVLLASYSTCAFVAAPLDTSKDCLIGSKDARDLLNDQATNYAKYSISNTMGCVDNAVTNWAVVRSV